MSTYLFSYNLPYNFDIVYINIVSMNVRNLKFLFIILLLLSFVVFGVFFKLNCDKEASRLYKQGEEFYKKENFSDAYYNFKQIKRTSDLYTLSLLKQIQCAQKLDDKKTARIKLLELIKKTKDENILPYAYYNEASISSELKIDSEEKQYRKYKYINEKYSRNDFAIASAYKIAKLKEKNEKDISKEKYLEYLQQAPNGKYSQSALLALNENDFSFTKEDREIIAYSYLCTKKYKEALEEYKKTAFSKNWNNIAKCYRGLKEIQNEKDTIIKGLELNTSTVEEKEISAAIDRLITITGADKIQTLQNLYTKYPNSYIFPTSAYKLAENSSSIRSIKLYELIISDYPESIWASNSLWEVFWYNYRLKRYQKCNELANQHILKYPNTPDAPRVAYWRGKVLLKEKQNQQAKEVFYNVIANYPLSYYSFLSARALKMSKAKKMIVKKQITSYDINSINKYLFKDKIILKLAQRNDFETIEELKINNEFIKSWAANKRESYPLSINLAKDEIYKKMNKAEKTPEDEKEQDLKKISFSDWELKLIYPVIYENEINDFAQKFQQSPYLFLSLIREESHFDKNAKSSAGALGLSQIMQPTADFIEKAKVTKEALLDKDENIRIGLKYFNYLVDYFKGNEYLAILAYNAGPGNINKWINNPSIESNEIDVFVENIPYLETRNYIKKILSSYWVYLNIYSPVNKIKTR